MKKVYLAGGLSSGWQAKVIEACASFIYFNPQDLNNPVDPYGASVERLRFIAVLERGAIRDCDIVFAYLEKDNPSGLGLSAEIGYGNAHHKHIIFVDERNDSRSAFI